MGSCICPVFEYLLQRQFTTAEQCSFLPSRLQHKITHSPPQSIKHLLHLTTDVKKFELPSEKEVASVFRALSKLLFRCTPVYTYDLAPPQCLSHRYRTHWLKRGFGSAEIDHYFLGPWCSSVVDSSFSHSRLLLGSFIQIPAHS